MPLRSALLALCLAACAAPEPPSPASRAAAPLASEAQIAAAETAPLQGDAAAWNRPVAPFTIIGNVHYVGVEGVSAFLITTPEGHILLDGAMAQSAPLILRNIATLGADIRDVKVILNSHAHWDHSGGLARLQRESGATMVASEADRAPLETGHITYGPASEIDALPVRVDRIVRDSDTVSLGGTTLTAVLTPGHTRGCTSWTMRTRGADNVERTVFFHCSATVAGHSLAPESYAGQVGDYRATFARVRGMQADVFLGSHPMFFDMAAKRARQLAGDENAFVDPAALGAFNDTLDRAFEAELARQQAAQR